MEHFPTKSYWFSIGNQWGNLQFYPASDAAGRLAHLEDPDQASHEMARYYLTHAEGGNQAVVACGNTDKFGDCLSQNYQDFTTLYDDDASRALDPNIPSTCWSDTTTKALIYGSTLLGTPPLPESAFLHFPTSISTAPPSLVTRERGAHPTTSAWINIPPNCGEVSWAIDVSDPAVIAFFNAWQLHPMSWYDAPAPNSDIATYDANGRHWAPVPVNNLGAFYLDDWSDDVGYYGGYFYTGGGCPPMTGPVGSGTTICYGSLEYGTSRVAADNAYAKFMSGVHHSDGSPMNWTINGCPGVDGPTWYQLGPQVADTSRFYNPAFMQHFIGCTSEGSVTKNVNDAGVDQVWVNGAPIGVYGYHIAGTLNTWSQFPKSVQVELLGYGAGGSLELNQRMINLGVCMLYWTPGTNNCIDWSDYHAAIPGHNINYPFWDEEFLIPWDPIQTMQPYTGTPTTNGIHGAADLQVATIHWVRNDTYHKNVNTVGGIFCREFRGLWLGHKMKDMHTPGAPATEIGRFAVCVNSTDIPTVMQQSWLTQTYTNTIVPVGGSIQDPNSHLDFSAPFVSGTTVIAPGSAVYLYAGVYGGQSAVYP